MSSKHFNRKGEAVMVDISHKRPVKRRAVAAAVVRMKRKTASMIRRRLVPKGDALAVARVAGIMAAKKTGELIPLCHPIGIESVGISFETGANMVRITSEAACTEKTGIEMEALTAVAVAALAIYDMCKGVDPDMWIESIRLLSKTKEMA